MATFRIIEEKEEGKRNIVRADEMKAGQIGRIINSNIPRYNGIIVFRSVSSDWTDPCTLQIELLKPGTRLTIEVGEDNIK